MKYICKIAIVSFLATVMAFSANAGPGYQSGKITNVTFVGGDVYIMLDVGVPDNCAGTPYGWMVIPGANKSMAAFVIGLWLRGDVTQVQMTVYSSGKDASGWCQLNQIDPAE